MKEPRDWGTSNGTHSVLTFPEEVVLLLLDDEEGDSLA